MQVDSLPAELQEKPKNTGVVAYPFSKDPPDTGIEPGSPALQEDSVPTEPSGKPQRTFSTITDGSWGDMIRIGLWLLASVKKSLTVGDMM